MISITPLHLRTDISAWCPVVIAIAFCASCAGPEDQSGTQAGVSVESRLQPWPAAADLSAEELAPGIQGIPLHARSSGAGPTMFTDLPAETTGVDFVSVVEAEHPQAVLYRSGLACSGLAIGDVDGDGWPDLYLAGGAGPNKLYRQVAGAKGAMGAIGAMGGLRFEDITARAGKIDGGDRWAGGVSMADVDADGDLDIYVVNYDAPNQLFVNQGVGADGMVTFVDMARSWESILWTHVRRQHFATTTTTVTSTFTF